MNRLCQQCTYNKECSQAEHWIIISCRFLKRKCHCNETDCIECSDYEHYTDYMIDLEKERKIEQRIEQLEQEQKQND